MYSKPNFDKEILDKKIFLLKYMGVYKLNFKIIVMIVSIIKNVKMYVVRIIKLIDTEL
ncbi:hypothetical protein GCM10011538_17440 [Ligilactobacillus murinus]